MGDVIKGIGKVASSAAPILGAIPGIGTIPAAIAGGAGGLMQGQGLGGALKGAAGGALGGLGGGILGKLGIGSGAGAGPLSGLAGSIGGALKNNFAPGGQLDLGKLVGSAGGIMNMIGQGQQRKSAQDYSNAEIAQRNNLMSKILGSKDFNMSQSPNLNAQSSATPGIGAGSPGAY